MKLSCELELTYSLAVSSGNIPCRSSRSRAAITLGKKPSSTAGGSGMKIRDELYVIVSTAKNVTGSKYKVRFSVHTPVENSASVCVLYSCVCGLQVKGNVGKVFSKFVEEGKATIEFKEPAHRLAISKVSLSNGHKKTTFFLSLPLSLCPFLSAPFLSLLPSCT